MHQITETERECRDAWFSAWIDWQTTQLNPHDPVDRALLAFAQIARSTRHLPDALRLPKINQVMGEALADIERFKQRKH